MPIIPFPQGGRKTVDYSISTLIEQVKSSPKVCEISYTKASLILFYCSYNLKSDLLKDAIQDALLLAVAQSAVRVSVSAPLVAHFDTLSHDVVGELIALGVSGP